MAVHAQTIETYDNRVIREDLAEMYSMISPEEVPFQTAIGTAPPATSTYHEWTTVDLAAPDNANRVIEGDDTPAVDPGTLANRLGNYTQISDKRIKTSHTSEAIDAAAENVQKLSKQMVLKLKELKRDMEVMLLSNVPAAAGASGTPRQAAGLPAWIRTNVNAGASGVNPTLSGGTSGYPNAAATAGTTRALTEAMFNDAITAAWTAGGNPTIAMVNPNNKRKISNSFTGSSTRYKDAVDKTLVAAIDVYDSDFGQLSIVPNRFLPTMATNNYYVPLLDTDLWGISFLETLRQKPLAETGHSKDRLAWCEYTLQSDNEAGNAIIRDTTGA